MIRVGILVTDLFYQRHEYYHFDLEGEGVNFSVSMNEKLF